MADLILVGCVKRKRCFAAPAKELYKSNLWNYRRAYAERAGCAWYILSAKHGLLAPETVIEPYDLALSWLAAPERREWSRQVLADLAVAVPTLRGRIVEIHAGKDYAENGLTDGLEALGATVRRPLAHVRLFDQPAWYGQKAALD